MSWRCELCHSQATISCESDKAKLCWECDSRVHGANFLVAKHTRTLLCHLCNSHTPWTGSGPRLTPIVTSCTSCAKLDRATNEDDEDEDEDEDEDDDDQMSDDDDDDEDEENQVVPWRDITSACSVSSSKGPNSQVSGSSSGTHSSRFFDRYPREEVCLPRRGFHLK